MRVKAFSEGYFQLTRRDPTLNQYFSLGQQVLVVVNGQAIQVADDGKEIFTEAELDSLLGKSRKISQAVEEMVEVALVHGAGGAGPSDDSDETAGETPVGQRILSGAAPPLGIAVLSLAVCCVVVGRRSRRRR